ncbi:MAG: 4Fe-4S dicluster domain-containing protein [Candidatus Caldarchaeum sp.]|nr:4Fe-4S dicluster domain-containing protein [Candidatus Caldarchaeum sp.]MDW8436243.1 4Fe-4S dicluster domain-containing protein [Candidatus Caldarchaeum sp.]
MKLAMVVDLNKCVGCYACVVECMVENIARRLPDGTLSLPDQPTNYARTRPYRVLTYAGDEKRVFIQCLHCEQPPCVYACPTGASFVSPEKVVLLDESKCIRCGLCIDACPYGVRTRLLTDYPGEVLHEHALKIGIPDKCTFCYHRNTGSGLWTPACVKACSFGARLFGDLDNPKDEVTRLVTSGLAVPPRDDLGTKPKLFYIPRKGAYEMVRYPIRGEDQGITYTMWSMMKDSLVKPLSVLAMVGATVLGIVHIIRERKKVKEE